MFKYKYKSPAAALLRGEKYVKGVTGTCWEAGPRHAGHHVYTFTIERLHFIIT